MKLYFVRSNGNALGFYGTQVKAKRAVKDFKGKYSGVTMEPVEVPTNKPGLLEWLNSWIEDK